MQVVELKEGRQTLHILEVETGAIQSYATSSLLHYQGGEWSPDSEWLLVAGGENLHLIAPSKAYERKVFYTSTSCNTAVWVERTP